MKSPSKYRNKKTVVDGITFHSKKEAKRYQELRLMERAGEICDLELQKRYDFIVNGIKLRQYYVADFVYRDVRRNIPIVEDVKGMCTQYYKIKKALVKAIHGIDIYET